MDSRFDFGLTCVEPVDGVLDGGVVQWCRRFVERRQRGDALVKLQQSIANRLFEVLLVHRLTISQLIRTLPLL